MIYYIRVFLTWVFGWKYYTLTFQTGKNSYKERTCKVRRLVRLHVEVVRNSISESAVLLNVQRVPKTDWEIREEGEN